MIVRLVLAFLRRRREAAFSVRGDGMRALVSDQSSSFNSKAIGGSPHSTVVASLELPQGSWVVFATVALAGNAAPGTTASVQMFFQLDGNRYGEPVRSNFTITDQSGAISGFQVVPSPRDWCSTRRKLCRLRVSRLRRTRRCLSRRRLPPSKWDR